LGNRGRLPRGAPSGLSDLSDLSHNIRLEAPSRLQACRSGAVWLFPSPPSLWSFRSLRSLYFGAAAPTRPGATLAGSRGIPLTGASRILAAFQFSPFLLFLLALLLEFFPAFFERIIRFCHIAQFNFYTPAAFLIRTGLNSVASRHWHTMHQCRFVLSRRFFSPQISHTKSSFFIMARGRD